MRVGNKPEVELNLDFRDYSTCPIVSKLTFNAAAPPPPVEGAAKYDGKGFISEHNIKFEEREFHVPKFNWNFPKIGSEIFLV